MKKTPYCKWLTGGNPPPRFFVLTPSLRICILPKRMKRSSIYLSSYLSTFLHIYLSSWMARRPARICLVPRRTKWTSSRLLETFPLSPTPPFLSTGKIKLCCWRNLHCLAKYSLNCLNISRKCVLQLLLFLI